MCPPPSIDFELRTDVLVKAVETKSVSTQEGYLTDVRRAAAALGELLGRSPSANDFMALDTAALGRLVEVWQQRNVAASTIRRRLVSVRKYVRQLALELGLSGPVLTAQYPRVPDYARTWEEEVNELQLIAAAKSAKGRQRAGRLY